MHTVTISGGVVKVGDAVFDLVAVMDQPKLLEDQLAENGLFYDVSIERIPGPFAPAARPNRAARRAR